jgi:hypothetical protein
MDNQYRILIILASVVFVGLFFIILELEMLRRSRIKHFQSNSEILNLIKSNLILNREEISTKLDKLISNNDVLRLSLNDVINNQTSTISSVFNNTITNQTSVISAVLNDTITNQTSVISAVLNDTITNQTSVISKVGKELEVNVTTILIAQMNQNSQKNINTIQALVDSSNSNYNNLIKESKNITISVVELKTSLENSVKF